MLRLFILCLPASDEFDIHGIELVKRISSRISYIRAIDLNNTVIEFYR
ncbi:MAG: hypothetical protein J1F01_10280 [Oscillospiraceae bacterium]|nr:hypothetical protein [Oscillospiraceae bacterium]